MSDSARLGCSTITFRMLDLPTALDRIAKSGVRTIDLAAIATFCPHVDPLSISDAELGRVGDLLERHGLRVASMNAWSLTHLNDEGGLERGYVEAALRLAPAVRAPVVTVQPGRTVEDGEWRASASVVAAELEELGAIARELGVELAIEAPHKGTLADDFGRACALIEMLDPELVHVCLDSSHVLNGGGTIADALERYGERIRHVHLRDYRDGSILVTPGDGVIDFGALVAGLEGLGYGGAYVIELELPQPTDELMARALERAIEHLVPWFPAPTGRATGRVRDG